MTALETLRFFIILYCSFSQIIISIILTFFDGIVNFLTKRFPSYFRSK